MSSAATDVVSFLVSFSTGVVVTLLWSRSGCGGGCWPTNLLRGKGQQMGAFLAQHGEPHKMALVVRKDLKMGTGKIASQCAHAAVAVVEDVQSRRRSVAAAAAAAAGGGGERGLDEAWVSWYDAWSFAGSTKVVLQCESEERLMATLRAAKREGLPHALIRDAGRTQIAPGSKTVLAVGPAPKTLVDHVTGSLKLL
ncbi:peptidyl-tRNA hydrolase, PTH2 family [Trypanosoma grayi]|uniref:peptidyl-tRNA hydrolase, PTH2 family n=1 Tax=Trypanosoma grayi TaxID=71804 RepID=UPI0004F434EE|nr:peptidyl-tRNA hydrolase, PTH2 family [Trypanosoma grayi]KEG12611.1 peptidyl-tRNA hydrolase, PTH2 family [Trypanosoma grayi]